MSAISPQSGPNWGTRLLVGLLLVLAGAAFAVWALARYEPAARVLGVVPAAQPPQSVLADPRIVAPTRLEVAAKPPDAFDRQEIASLKQRVARIEGVTQQAAGSAGRADALVVAFAARRAIDRGVALGYLEKLLVERFGERHQAAVGTIIAASHQPVRLNDLIAEYEVLGPQLRRGGPGDSWWDNFTRELGGLVEIHRVGDPPASPDAQYQFAMRRLNAGDVDQALAQTMRMPGATRAGDWVAKARRYVAAHRALDQIESAALLGR